MLAVGVGAGITAAAAESAGADLLVATAAGCAWVGVLMLRNGRSRRVDAAGLLAYVGQD